MSHTKLKFNLERLSEMRSMIDGLASELVETSSELKKSMDELQKDWNTPAGRAFFEEQSTTWTEEVDKYVSILNTLQDMLSYAIEQYATVEESAKNLSC